MKRKKEGERNKERKLDSIRKSMYNVGNRLLIVDAYFFFNDTATTEIYTLSLHDALPIWTRRRLRTY